MRHGCPYHTRMASLSFTSSRSLKQRAGYPKAVASETVFTMTPTISKFEHLPPDTPRHTRLLQLLPPLPPLLQLLHLLLQLLPPLLPLLFSSGVVNSVALRVGLLEHVGLLEVLLLTHVGVAAGKLGPAGGCRPWRVAWRRGVSECVGSVWGYRQHGNGILFRVKASIAGKPWPRARA